MRWTIGYRPSQFLLLSLTLLACSSPALAAWPGKMTAPLPLTCNALFTSASGPEQMHAEVNEILKAAAQIARKHNSKTIEIVHVAHALGNSNSAAVRQALERAGINPVLLVQKVGGLGKEKDLGRDPGNSIDLDRLKDQLMYSSTHATEGYGDTVGLARRLDPGAFRPEELGRRTHPRIERSQAQGRAAR
jgi:hypothetical protein